MESRTPQYKISGALASVATGDELGRIMRDAAPAHLRRQRWFGGKGRQISAVSLQDYSALRLEPYVLVLALIQTSYRDGPPEAFFLPLAARSDALQETCSIIRPDEIMAMLDSDSGLAVMYDALADQEFCKEIFRLIGRSGHAEANGGAFYFSHVGQLHDWFSTATVSAVRRLGAEQSNSSVVLQMTSGEALILKNFRRIENGVNPDFEISHFLTTRAGFGNTPQLLGYAMYRGRDGFTAAISALQRFIANSGSGWDYTLEHLKALYQMASQETCRGGRAHASQATASLKLESDRARIWDVTRQFAQAYLYDIARLGQVTGDLHRALASDTSDPDFRPEPITPADVGQWMANMTDHLHRAMRTIRQQLDQHPQSIQAELLEIIDNERLYEKKLEDLRHLADARVVKTRCHGDYHLGQILKTETDFVILDFEGEPARPLADRRAKQSPLKDVAGMLRSFAYAAHAALIDVTATRPEEMEPFEAWAEAWEGLASRAFLEAYLAQTSSGGVKLLPECRKSIDQILSAYQLDKAVYELNYEMNNRPDWLRIPLKGMRKFLVEA